MEARVDPSYLGPASTFIGIPMLFIIGFLFIYGTIKRWPFFVPRGDHYRGWPWHSYIVLRKYIGVKGIIILNYLLGALSILLGTLGILGFFGVNIFPIRLF